MPNTDDCIDIIVLENGKYEIRRDTKTYTTIAYRYGSPWRDLSGDKIIKALINEVLKKNQNGNY